MVYFSKSKVTNLVITRRWQKTMWWSLLPLL